MLKPLPKFKGCLIKRKLAIQPAFHETDMMGVIHNSNFFLWFERGRLQIMLEVLSVEEAMKLNVFMPVVENLCHYRKPVKFGMPLLLYTTHNLQPTYKGRLVFSHYLIHEKQRTAMAFGQTAMTMVDMHTNKLITRVASIKGARVKSKFLSVANGTCPPKTGGVKNFWRGCSMNHRARMKWW